VPVLCMRSPGWGEHIIARFTELCDKGQVCVNAAPQLRMRSASSGHWRERVLT
jgi:hypothetical protein